MKHRRHARQFPALTDDQLEVLAPLARDQVEEKQDRPDHRDEEHEEHGHVAGEEGARGGAAAALEHEQEESKVQHDERAAAADRDSGDYGADERYRIGDK